MDYLLINYLEWVCPEKRTWSLEHFDVGKQCHYRRDQKCKNPNCSGNMPNQRFRNFLIDIRFRPYSKR